MNTPPHIDINCDLGEGEPPSVTESLMRCITSCNIACGGHFGDTVSMQVTSSLALRHRVAIGAHPSFLDRKNFGRQPMQIDADGLQRLLSDQVGPFDSILRSRGHTLHHIKLHGALYNLVERDAFLAYAYAGWVKKHFPDAFIIALTEGCVVKAAKQIGIRVVQEFFADRAYNDDGTLVRREQKGAVLEDIEFLCDRALRVVKDRSLHTITGRVIPMRADTICIHSDTPQSVQIATCLRQSLEQAGVVVRTF